MNAGPLNVDITGTAVRLLFSRPRRRSIATKRQGAAIRRARLCWADMGPVTIPDNYVFVMGDNQDHSDDSRFWGTVPIDDIEGTARFVYSSDDWSRTGSSP